jgi:hypothetical protein
LPPGTVLDIDAQGGQPSPQIASISDREGYQHLSMLSRVEILHDNTPSLPGAKKSDRHGFQILHFRNLSYILRHVIEKTREEVRRPFTAQTLSLAEVLNVEAQSAYNTA